MILQMENRPLSALEKEALKTLASGITVDLRSSVLADLEHVTVNAINSDKSIFEFVHEGYVRPDSGQMPAGYEGVVNDTDDAEIEVILYCDRNFKICEFELLKWSEADVIKPRWETFRLKT